MTDITPANAKIQQESVQFRAAVSEAAGTAIGAAINYALDQLPLKALATDVAALTARVNNAVSRAEIYSQVVTLNFSTPTESLKLAIITGSTNYGIQTIIAGIPTFYVTQLDSGIPASSNREAQIYFEQAAGPNDYNVRLVIWEYALV